MIRGWEVDISAHSYSTPSCCSSCCGPRETEVTAKISEKTGNIRHTLTMEFPYCRTCASRARFEKVRQVVVGILSALLGLGLTLSAWAFDVLLEAPFRFAAALVAAIALSGLLALLTRRSIPKPPATARGEAVILRDTTGTVLCTNQRFAEVLATENRARVRPGSKWFTVELWSPVAAALVGTLVLVTWIQAGAPEGGVDLGLSAAAPTATPSSTSSAAPKTAATAPPPKKPYSHAATKK
jgi:hypothetical protein